MRDMRNLLAASLTGFLGLVTVPTGCMKTPEPLLVSATVPVAAPTTSDVGFTIRPKLNPTALRSFHGPVAVDARQSIGDKVDPRMTDHFVLLTAAGSDQLSDIAQLLETTHRSFFEVFADAGAAEPIQAPLVWMVFQEREAYEQYAQRADGMDMSWAKAYYSAQTNRVAIALYDGASQARGEAASLVTLGEGPGATALTTDARFCAQVTHEAGHQLAFNSGLQSRGVMYPLWVSEGLAANFEIDSRGRLGPGSDNPLRLRHVTQAWNDKQLVDFKNWVALTRLPFNKPRQTNAIYGQSWAFFRFLYEHRRAQLMGYLAHMADQRPGRRTEQALYEDFAGCFEDVPKLEKEWLAYVEKLVPAPRTVVAIETP